MILAMIAALALLAVSALPAYGIQCKHQGKSWRLVDGKRCWTDRWMPKDRLYWATTTKPVTKVSRPARFRAAPVPRTMPAPEPPAPKFEDVRAMLEVRAQEARALEARAEELLRARLDAPRVVRTILVNPYPAVEVIEVPMPRARPVTAAHSRPAGLLWLPLLLMGLMIGTAAAEGEQ